MSVFTPHLMALTGEDGAERHTGMTRREAISLSLLATAAILIGFTLIPFIAAVVTPVPFYYRNLPFQLTDGHGSELPLDGRAQFRPGDVVPFVVERCAQEVLDPDGMLPYNVSRNLVNAATGSRLILPALATSVKADGCDRSETLAHALPETLAPGRYYLEGVATVYGRFRVATAYFRTQEFEVVPK